MNRITRRKLAVALSAGALSAPAVLLAQEQRPADEEMQAWRTQLRENADQLDKFPLPMAVEPATIFKP
jgi:hypothetical protein